MIRSVKSFLSKRGDVFKSVMTFINSASSQKEPSTLKTTTASEHSQKARNTGSLFRVTRTDFTTPWSQTCSSHTHRANLRLDVPNGDENDSESPRFNFSFLVSDNVPSGTSLLREWRDVTVLSFKTPSPWYVTYCTYLPSEACPSPLGPPRTGELSV